MRAILHIWAQVVVLHSKSQLTGEEDTIGLVEVTFYEGNDLGDEFWVLPAFSRASHQQWIYSVWEKNQPCTE